MFKKFVFISILTFAVFSLTGIIGPAAFAQDDVPTGNLQDPGFMFDVGVVTHEDIDPQSWIRGGINFVFSRLIGIMAATIGSVAVLIMVIGGLRMIIYAGNSDEFEKAKGMIKKAALGLVFVLGAYIMVTAIQLLIKGIYA
jgi:hypothetical protein